MFLDTRRAYATAGAGLLLRRARTAAAPARAAGVAPGLRAEVPQVVCPACGPCREYSTHCRPHIEHDAADCFSCHIVVAENGACTGHLTCNVTVIAVSIRSWCAGMARAPARTSRRWCSRASTPCPPAQLQTPARLQISTRTAMQSGRASGSGPVRAVRTVPALHGRQKNSSRSTSGSR